MSGNLKLPIGVLFVVVSLIGCFSSWPAFAATNEDRPTVIVVVGAAGEPEYGSNFVQQAALWDKACGQSGCREIVIGRGADGATNDFNVFQQTLAAEPREGSRPLWLVLIGHGTFDGKEGRFNLRGPDVSATDLAEWLKPFQRPLAIVDTTASSAPFLAKLSRTNRVVITATRSGNERNFTRFGEYFAQAIADPEADLDKDGEVSLLEAFLVASRRAGEFYKVEGRIATEHALMDDNGDGLGTAADWFRGLRATKRAKDKAALDGLLGRQFQLAPGEADRTLTPEQRARRDALERSILQLRDRKSGMSEDEYYAQLERQLLEMARLYQTNGGAQ